MAKIPTVYERRWPTVVQTPISVSNHVVTVPSTDGLYVKQAIVLSNLGQEPLELEIKRVLSDTQLQVGAVGHPITEYVNPTAYTGGTLTASEQERNKFGADIVWRAVYAEEPIVAIRTIGVDKHGQFLDTITDNNGVNRLAVDANVTVSGISVDLDAITPPNRPDPDNVLVVGSTDGTKGGVKAPMRVDLEGHVKTINIGQIVTKYFDYIATTYPSPTQEIYTFRMGGPSGTITTIVTVDYTTASKKNILTVFKQEF